jgi:transposase
MDMEAGFELILEILEKHFGKRGSKIVVCLVLMMFGITHSEIKQKFGTSYNALRRYRAALKESHIEQLFIKKGPREQSELEKYNKEIADEFERNPPKTLRDAQERIKRLTGITRSLHRIRVYLIKRGLKAGL